MPQELPSRALGAILFVQASTNVVDVFSALNSSPWTAESFGGDPDKAASCWRYVLHSLAVAGFYSVMAALIARSLWPIVGYALAGSYMLAVYRRALMRAAGAGNTGW